MNLISPDHVEQTKVAALYHEKIFLPFGSLQYETAFGSNFAAGGERLLQSDLDELRKVFPSVTELAQNIDGDYIASKAAGAGVVQERRSGLRSAARRVLAREEGISVTTSYRRQRRSVDDWYQWNGNIVGLIANSIRAAEAWRLVNQKYPISFLAQTEVEYLAATRRISSPTSPVNDATLSEIELLVPRLSSISWNDVLELRHHPSLVHFRKWLHHISEAGETEESVDQVWQAMSKLIPNTTVSAMKSVVTNIPSPIGVNPAAVAASVHETRQAANFHSDHGAMVFLHDVWSRSNETKRPSLPRRIVKKMGFRSTAF